MLTLKFLGQPPIDPEENGRSTQKDNVRPLRILNRMPDTVVKDFVILNLKRYFIIMIPGAVTVERNRGGVILVGRIAPPKDQYEEKRNGRDEA